MMKWDVKNQIVSISRSHGHVKFTFKVTEVKFSVKKRNLSPSLFSLGKIPRLKAESKVKENRQRKEM